uniref:Uncharacterized protein n=1 Tax=Romanomermis culicivorax TaxID=13658 RepID=A0A915HKR3_ROMCU
MFFPCNVEHLGVYLDEKSVQENDQNLALSLAALKCAKSRCGEALKINSELDGNTCVMAGFSTKKCPDNGGENAEKMN